MPSKYNDDLSRKEHRRITKWLIGYTKDVYKLHNGVRGLVKEIKKESNGNGEEYYKDFLSFYQSDGVRYLIEKKRILIADEMGVGKTAQAVAGKLELENRSGEKVKCLIVVPNDLKEQWEDKINEYCKKPQTIEILDQKSYRDIKGFLDQAKNADFLIVNYNIFSTNKINKQIADSLVNSGYNYVVFDEAHNAKNMSSVRSTFIKKVADQVEYLCLLSGTPIPNNLRDTYMLISLLDPQNYPTPENARRRHQYDPGMIRAVLWRRLLKRKIGDVEKLPPISFNTQYEGVLDLTSEQREIYQAVYENDELEGGSKIHELRKALLDPSLVRPSVIYDSELRSRAKEIESGKYRKMDEIIREKIGKGEKVVVFSPFYKNGVTKNLENRYKEYGAIRIDGDLDVETRRELRKEFNTNPEKKVLIATMATTGEGVSLTSANNIIFVDEPYTPAARNQAISRVYRRGQTKPVEVISLAVKNSIDEGVLELLKWKDEGLKMLERGDKLDPNHMSVFLDETVETTPIKKRLYTPQQIVGRYSIQMKMLESMRGHEKLEKELMKNDWSIAKQYAENYIKDWETSYSGNTSRAYKKIIDGISKSIDLSRKLDLGSGPGILSHVLNEPTVNVDLNPKNFEQGFAHSKSRNIVASFDDLKKELSDESFDLVVSSLSLDYTSTKPKDSEKTEREKSLREANRILRKDGYLLVTLPHREVDPIVSLKMQKEISNLGFDMVPELSGMVRSGTENADFQVYIGVYNKTREPSDKPLSQDALELKEIDEKKSDYVMRKKGVVKDFVFTDGENLESRLNKYLERTSRS